MKKFTEYFSINENVNESHIEPLLSRIRKTTDEYPKELLQDYHEQKVLAKSTFKVKERQGGGISKWSGSYFEQADVYNAIEAFPGITPTELQICMGGKDFWKNVDQKVQALLKKGQIIQTSDFLPKGRSKSVFFTTNDYADFVKYKQENKIGNVKLTEEVEVHIGADFLSTFKEKFPTLVFNEDESNLTQKWISDFGDSLEDGNMNQFKEYLIGNSFASLKVEEGEKCDYVVGDRIDFEFEFAGKSKLKQKAEIISIKGNNLKVKVLTGEMKGKTTDITLDMICEEQINEELSTSIPKRYNSMKESFSRLGDAVKQKDHAQILECAEEIKYDVEKLLSVL